MVSLLQNVHNRGWFLAFCREKTQFATFIAKIMEKFIVLEMCVGRLVRRARYEDV
jgi:hypothetical protein